MGNAATIQPTKIHFNARGNIKPVRPITKPTAIRIVPAVV